MCIRGAGFLSERARDQPTLVVLSGGQVQACSATCACARGRTTSLPLMLFGRLLAVLFRGCSVGWRCGVLRGASFSRYCVVVSCARLCPTDGVGRTFASDRCSCQWGLAGLVSRCTRLLVLLRCMLLGIGKFPHRLRHFATTSRRDRLAGMLAPSDSFAAPPPPQRKLPIDPGAPHPELFP